MASFFERAKKIIKEDQDILAMYEEYDRTHVLKRKVTYKDRFNFTLDEELMARFRKHCKDKNIKMSNIVENLIRKELKSS